jgi:type III pantothenate kinase
MILELDCGNSLIKWRLVSGEGIRSGSAPDRDSLVHLLRGEFCYESLSAIRLVSVRSELETQAIACELQNAYGLACCVAQPAAQLGGVINGYDDYRSLGMDRWLAVVGAYALTRQACLVIDFGTAITADFVSASGQHLGGFICPGVPLLRAELRTHTGRIRYGDEAAQSALASFEPGRGTAQAVERGCLWMIRGFLREQLDLADHLLEPGYEIFLTGGDAELFSEFIPDARLAPDLIFSGLAIACPLK